MTPTAISRILGLFILIFSIMMLPPFAISLLYHDGEKLTYIFSFVIDVAIGLSLWLPFYKVKKDLKIRDGFLIISLFWILTGLLASLPFIISTSTPISITDAIFESFSGITTTGATVLTHLESLPESLLWYRQQLQWFGGMSIIILAMSLLPMLGIGGMQFYRSFSIGQIKENKLTPRIAQTAKALSLIYLGITVLCAFSYWLAGMTVFDAITQSFSTVSLGGFSTHSENLGYYKNYKIEWVAILFMVISGVNFALHFGLFHRKSFRIYWKDSEFKFYLSVLLSISLITITTLYATGTFTLSNSFLRGLFETVSFVTTAGFTAADYSHWPHILPYLLLVCVFIGGCAGSTSGGLKMIRVLLIFQQGGREIKRLIHPNAIIPVKIGKRSVPEPVLRSVWGFFSIYMFMFVLILIGLLATGMDQISAWSAVSATLNNLGPGLGAVANTYAYISDPAKWLLSFSMLLGRVEVFALLIIFTPAFWSESF